MKKLNWLDDYTLNLICPKTNKIFKTYDGLVHLANELHTDIFCNECMEKHLLIENLIILVKN